MDMHSMVDDLYERATEFMHKSGLHMHEDFVGKSHDLYLWSFICESKSASVWGCPMRFYFRLLCGHPHYGEREVSVA